MNLKVDRVQPQLPSNFKPFILTFISELQALLFYPTPPLIQKPEQPKKKFAFKANAASVPTTQNIHLFQLKNSVWRTQQTKGKFPTRRQNAAVVSMGTCLMVFGGQQLNPSKPVNDLYSLNWTTWQWKKLFTMEAPPVNSSPFVVTISQSKLLVLDRQLWVFSAKDVKWQLNKDDLPGGLWQKLEAEIPFIPRCGSFLNEELIIFGWQDCLKAASIEIQNKKMEMLQIQNKSFSQLKGSKIQMCNTSQSIGLLIDRNKFMTIQKNKNTVFIENMTISQEFIFQKIVAVEQKQQNSRFNYGITTNNQFVSVQLITNSVQSHQQDEDLPNTARQLDAIQQHQTSLIEMEHQLSTSSIPPQRSPISEQQAISAKILPHLSPLLARQWLRRRILEQKGQLLQKSIKKAQKMVLALCKYGSEQEKRSHIGRVRKLRQSLYGVFNRQSYYRKQMDERPGQNDLRDQAIRDEGGLTSSFCQME